jgi:hypothetical protein
MACSEEWACFPAWSGSRSSSPSTADGFARLRIFAGRFRTFMVFVREGPGYARWARVRQRRRRRLPPTGVGDPRPIPSAIKCRPLPPSREVTLGRSPGGASPPAAIVKLPCRRLLLMASAPGEGPTPSGSPTRPSSPAIAVAQQMPRTRPWQHPNRLQGGHPGSDRRRGCRG